MIDDWKKSFENEVFFGGEINAIKWAKDKLGEIKISTKGSPIIKKNVSETIFAEEQSLNFRASICFPKFPK